MGQLTSYAVADMLDLPVRPGSLDVVLSKSVLGAIARHDRLDRAWDAIESARTSLKSGGEYWFAENLRGSAAHSVARRIGGAARGGWHYPTLHQIRELFASYESLELTTTGVLAAFGRTERQREKLSRIDTRLQGRTARRWHYVAFGVARK